MRAAEISVYVFVRLNVILLYSTRSFDWQLFSRCFRRFSTVSLKFPGVRLWMGVRERERKRDKMENEALMR